MALGVAIHKLLCSLKTIHLCVHSSTRFESAGGLEKGEEDDLGISCIRVFLQSGDTH